MNKYATRVAELGGKWIFQNEPPIHLADAEITAFEQKIGYTLPADYREFLRDFGGYSLSATYLLLDGPAYMSSGSIGMLFGLNSNYDLSREYLESVTEKFISPELLIIAEDNANRICLFLDGPKKGQIHYWVHEEVQIPFDYANLYFIANSFDDFMQILVRYED